MAGLSRRAFLSQAAALAALTGVETHCLGHLLATPLLPTADAASTLAGTVRQGAVTTGSYRRLVSGPGEPYLARLDVLGRAPAAAPRAARCCTSATCPTCTSSTPSRPAASSR